MTGRAAPKVTKRAVDAWIDGPAGESPPSGISETLVHLIDRLKSVVPPEDYVAGALANRHRAYGEPEERRRWMLLDWCCRSAVATWLRAAGQRVVVDPEDVQGLGEVRGVSALPALVDALVAARQSAELDDEDLPEVLGALAEVMVEEWARDEVGGDGFAAEEFSLAEQRLCDRAAEIRIEAAADEALWLSGVGAALDAAAMCWLWPPESPASQALVAARATLHAVVRRVAMQEVVFDVGLEQGSPPREHQGWSDLSQEVSISLGDAARTGLRPIIDSLQASAEDLLARMLDVGRE